MQQLIDHPSPTLRPRPNRDDLAKRALGATVSFYTDSQPSKRRKGRVVFADIDTLHLLVEDRYGDELVPLGNCRVVSLRRDTLELFLRAAKRLALRRRLAWLRARAVRAAA